MPPRRSFLVNVADQLAQIYRGPILIKETGVPTAPAAAGFSELRQGLDDTARHGKAAAAPVSAAAAEARALRQAQRDTPACRACGCACRNRLPSHHRRGPHEVAPDGNENEIGEQNERPPHVVADDIAFLTHKAAG
jgi:hypothetical protein